MIKPTTTGWPLYGQCTIPRHFPHFSRHSTLNPKPRDHILHMPYSHYCKFSLYKHIVLSISSTAFCQLTLVNICLILYKQQFPWHNSPPPDNSLTKGQFPYKYLPEKLVTLQLGVKCTLSGQNVLHNHTLANASFIHPRQTDRHTNRQIERQTDEQTYSLPVL